MAAAAANVAAAEVRRANQLIYDQIAALGTFTGDSDAWYDWQKNFLVTLPRHCLLLSLLSRRRSLLVICCQINLRFLFNWLFIHLKSGYSTIPSRILKLFLVSEPGKLLKRYAFSFDIRAVKAVVKVAIRVTEEYLPGGEELSQALKHLSLKKRKS